MRIRTMRLAVLATMLALGLGAGAATAGDAAKGARGLDDLVKLRCSLEAKDEVIVWWTGTLFGMQGNTAPKPLLGFEGYNICRSERQADGSWRLLTRELTFYRDRKTGQIIDQWDNPYTKQRTSVVHVANDPVNTVFKPGGYPLPWVEAGDTVMLTLNIPLAYPNPLTPAEFPKESSGAMYTGSEHFAFFAPTAQMDDSNVKQVAVQVGWTRIGPWLPWMEMGQADGRLLYVGQGNKKASIAELPADIQERVRTQYPEYASAPSEWVEPNMTSWTYYKQLKQSAGKAE